MAASLRSLYEISNIVNVLLMSASGTWRRWSGYDTFIHLHRYSYILSRGYYDSREIKSVTVSEASSHSFYRVAVHCTFDFRKPFFLVQWNVVLLLICYSGIDRWDYYSAIFNLIRESKIIFYVFPTNYRNNRTMK